MNFDRYYEPPDDAGDFITSLMDDINEFIVEKNPAEEPDSYDEHERDASCVLESLVHAAMKDEKLLDALRSHIQWAKQSYRQERRNIYDEARDLYEAMVNHKGE
jgi:hypothetical protein